jgi:hypothetical protein
MIFVRSALALLLLSSTAISQVELSYTIRKTIVGAVNAEILPGGRILIDDDSKIAGSVVAEVRATSKNPYKFEAMKSLTEYATLIPLPDRVLEGVTTKRFLLTGEGFFVFKATSRTDDLDRSIEITIGKPEPIPPLPIPPGPDPQPNVPKDDFDNIGQRVAGWASGLPKTKEVSAVYAKYAKELRTNPAMQITQAFSQASAERIALLGADSTRYNDVTDKINADIKARGAMSKGVVADYFTALAAGYAGAK